jgi:hypothetical protein
MDSEAGEKGKKQISIIVVQNCIRTHRFSKLIAWICTVRVGTFAQGFSVRVVW